MVEKSSNKESIGTMMEKFAFMKNAYSGLELFVKIIPYLDLKELIFWWNFFWPLVPLFWMFHSSSSFKM